MIFMCYECSNYWSVDSWPDERLCPACEAPYYQVDLMRQSEEFFLSLIQKLEKRIELLERFNDKLSDEVIEKIKALIYGIEKD